MVRRSAAIDIARQGQAASVPHGLPPHWSVPPDQLGGLINAMLTTLTGKEVTAALADLAGTDILAIPHPRVMHIVTERPIPDVLDTTGLRAIPDAGDSRGAHLLADPTLDVLVGRRRLQPGSPHHEVTASAPRLPVRPDHGCSAKTWTATFNHS